MHDFSEYAFDGSFYCDLVAGHLAPHGSLPRAHSCIPPGLPKFVPILKQLRELAIQDAILFVRNSPGYDIPRYFSQYL